MWEGAYVHGAGTAVVTSGQLAGATALVSPFSHRITATTAISSPANGDYALHRQKIEGYRVARLGWGAAGALDVTIAFNIFATAAGVGFIRVSNAAGNRFYYREFTAAAGAYATICETIPGDTSGTWQKTTSAGLIIEIYVSGKAASPAAPNAWGATGTTQTTNSVNLLGTNNNLTAVTDLVVVPGAHKITGAMLPYFVRPYDVELALCNRYWWQWIGAASSPLFVGNMYDTTHAWGKIIDLPVEMRVAPTCTVSNVAHFQMYGTAGQNISVVDFTGTKTNMIATYTGWTAGGVAGANGNGAIIYGNNASATLFANARL